VSGKRPVSDACDDAGMTQDHDGPNHVPNHEPNRHFDRQYDHHPVDLLATMTPTERAVAELITSGASNREIGHELFMSHHTVEAHLTHLYAKLGVRSRVQLAVLMTIAQVSVATGDLSGLEGVS
jgi:DNA-binding NarL/FixJ family response regulator